LCDDKKTKLDVIHIHPEAIIPGEQLESDRYLILIEEEKSSSNPAPSERLKCYPTNPKALHVQLRPSLGGGITNRDTIGFGGGTETITGNQNKMTTGMRTGLKRRKTVSNSEKIERIYQGKNSKYFYIEHG